MFFLGVGISMVTGENTNISILVFDLYKYYIDSI